MSENNLLIEDVEILNENFFKSTAIYSTGIDVGQPIPVVITFVKDRQEIGQIVMPQLNTEDKTIQFLAVMVFLKFADVDTVIYHLDSYIKRVEELDGVAPSLDPNSEECIITCGVKRDELAGSTTIYGREDDGKLKKKDHFSTTDEDELQSWMVDAIRFTWENPLPEDVDIEGFKEAWMKQMDRLGAMVVTYDKEIFKNVPNVSETSEMEEYLDETGGTDSKFIKDVRARFDVDESYLEQIADNIRRRHITDENSGQEMKHDDSDLDLLSDFVERTHDYLGTLSELLEEDKVEEAKEMLRLTLSEYEEE